MSYIASKIYDSDKRAKIAIDKLLEEEGIRRDENLDYTCAIYNENMEVIATGSCFKNTLRCLAVSSKYQGEGLMNTIITHLFEEQSQRGNMHLFIYTKISTAKFFSDLGFYEIATIEDNLVFMETKKNGFSNYLQNFSKYAVEKPRVAALVMNANPFTLGHQYLVETASKENDVVHLFAVSEDESIVPFDIRKKLIIEGTKHLNNIIHHNTGDYIISSSTFPSYFQKDKEDVIKGQTLLDATIFSKIAKVLKLTHRYVGEEPTSFVTNIYNQSMSEILKENGVDVVVIKRKEINNLVISASTVRKAIQEDDINLLKEMLPKTTLDYILSDEGKSLVEKIKSAGNVVHY